MSITVSNHLYDTVNANVLTWEWQLLVPLLLHVLFLLLLIQLQKTLPVLVAATAGGARSNVAAPASTTYATHSAAMVVCATLPSLQEYS